MLKNLIELDKTIFLKIHNFSKDNEKVLKVADFFANLSKSIFVLIYLILLSYAYFIKFEKILYIILIPFMGLITSIFLRKIINRKRPCEVFPTMNLPIKNQGSFPSNHSVCAVLISAACMYINFDVGIVILNIALLSGVSRVLIGIHFPLDVIFGFFLGGIFSFLYMI